MLIQNTSFQIQKLLQTKIYTNSNTTFWHSFLCSFTWYDLFCSECCPQKLLSNWWKFFNSQSEAPIYVVFKANTPNKMNHTMRKSMKNCARKWFQKLCTFLFEVTSAFGKMKPLFKVLLSSKKSYFGYPLWDNWFRQKSMLFRAVVLCNGTKSSKFRN